MFSPLAVITTVLLYIGLLFGIAQWVERRIKTNEKAFRKPWIYALSLAVFHTSWTFYGSVGFASTSGTLYLSIYAGAILGISLWWVVLRKMVAAKEAFRITSIADFISTRYRRSQKIAGLVTLIALIGLLPYIALQIKAIISSFNIITLPDEATSGEHTGLLVTALMAAFTIIFGVRRLDPTERHQGMIVALVVESCIKLIAFLAVGLFVTYMLFDGFNDLFTQVQQQELHRLFQTRKEDQSLWITLAVLSFAAVYLLPRQFHVGVIENSDQQHIKTAMWLFPLYIIAINLFVIPIAAAGLLTGLDASQADFFVLLLPQAAEQDALTLFAFIGGFSAATGMILITTMTLSTMVSNHWIMPLLERFPTLQPLRVYLLQIRWLLVVLILMGSYGFEREFSDSYILVAIGLLSFVAILQFAPATFGGIFWQKANSAGAFAGLLAGFTIWGYTLGLPTFIKQGWLNESILLYGPWGIDLLRPEALLGLDGFHPITHSVIWTLAFNIGFYVIGSWIYHPHKEERTLTTEFLASMQPVNSSPKARPTGLDAYISLPIKIDEAQNLLANYLPAEKAQDAVYTIAEDLQVLGKPHITIIELMEFHRMVEHVLAGSIGAASAHNAIEQSIRYSERESSDLKALYSHILSELNNSQEIVHSGDDESDASLPNGFGMLSSLQRQIDEYETTVFEQKQRIQHLEEKLEVHYQETFDFRLEAQKLRQENTDLREQISLLNHRDS